jgi:protocatechuate 3,4-dioxygenase beta subunit
MSGPDEISRRHVLGASAALGGLAMLTGAGPLIAEQLKRTPAQVMGPFYPLAKPLDQDDDLTKIRGHTERATGQVIYVMGRVLNTHEQPLPDVRIEIWQANAHGRYMHPSDRNPAPLDPNFQGYAALTSDAQGRYGFKTIKPGAYPADGLMRAPHIHFDITGRLNRIVTQMYFAGEPLNLQDRILGAAGENRERLIVLLKPAPADLEPGSLVATWDLVLDDG